MGIFDAFKKKKSDDLPPLPQDLTPPKPTSADNAFKPPQANIPAPEKGTLPNAFEPPVPVHEEKKDIGKAPEPPKPIQMDKEPNFHELLEKHSVDNPHSSNDSSAFAPASSLPSEKKETDADELNFDDLDLSFPDDLDVQSDTSHDEKESEDISHEDFLDKLDGNMQQDDDSHEEDYEEEHHFAKATSQKKSQIADGPVFMEAKVAQSIVDEISGVHALPLHNHYIHLFDREEKTISQFHAKLEDMQTKLAKVDRKLF